MAASAGNICFSHSSNVDHQSPTFPEKNNVRTLSSVTNSSYPQGCQKLQNGFQKNVFRQNSSFRSSLRSSKVSRPKTEPTGKVNIRRRLVVVPQATGRDFGSEVKAMAADAENFSDGMAANIANPPLDFVLEESEEEVEEVAPEYTSWNRTTETLTLSSTFAGLFLMAPQIWKNAEYLIAGQLDTLSILPWVGYSTGFLGNMLLLSYFASKRELSATLVQGVGATSTCVLLSQIYLAGFMPPVAFFSVASFLVCGLFINTLQYLGTLPRTFWAIWQDFIGIIGLAVLPQVVWQTFSSVQTYIPGIAAVVAGVSFVIALRLGKVSKELRKSWDKLGGWTATLLFMFMPVAQLQACFTNPESLAGISVLSPVMGIVANGLMIPRALFIRDLMWFTGATWGALMMGWAVLLSMFLNQVITPPLFFGVTSALLTYLGTVLFKDSKAYRLTSPFSSLGNLFRGES